MTGEPLKVEGACRFGRTRCETFPDMSRWPDLMAEDVPR